MAKDKLSKSEAKQRVYPKPGKIDTFHDIKEMVKEIENDNISNDLKRKRIQYLYALTHTENWKRKLRGKLREIRSYLKHKYQKYVKSKPKKPKKKRKKSRR